MHSLRGIVATALAIATLSCETRDRAQLGGVMAAPPGAMAGVPAQPMADVPGAAGTASTAGAAGMEAGGGSAAAGMRAPDKPDAGMTPPPAKDDDMDAGTAGPEPAPGLPVFVTDGAPLEGKVGMWTLTEFPDTQCRDGSPAGVFLNLGTTKKLMIFLEGGGKCADSATCAALNAANISAGDLVRGAASAGVLDRSKLENPVRDWNFVYIPYCTGDRHGGANPDANVPGVGPQKLVGYTNMKRLLNRIVPTFRDATDVLLTGISAGGFGVAYTGVLVQRAFPKLKVRAIIDSGPFVSKAVFSECDQRKTRELYKAEQTFLGECGLACPNPDDFWLDYGKFFARTFADRPSGLISSTGDLVERAFFGVGADDCTAALDLLNPPLSAATFRSELLNLRTTLAPYPSFATFYPDGETHTFIAFDEFYTVKAGDVRLVDWFTRIVNGDNPGHAGP